MLLGDLVIMQALQAELDAVRGDPSRLDDLFAGAPAREVEMARRYFTDPQRQVTIRQGYRPEPVSAPLLCVALAGEQEDEELIGQVVDDGHTPDLDARTALSLAYLGAEHRQNATGVEPATRYIAQAAVFSVGGPLVLRVVDPTVQPVTLHPDSQTIALDGGGTPITCAALAALLNATGHWQATAHPDYAAQPATLLDRQVVEGLATAGGGALRVGPNAYARTYGTYFRATWRVSALAPQAHAAIWLHAFAKWALLRNRTALQQAGLLEQSLAGGDVEPAVEWQPDFGVQRGLMLTALYLATYTDRVPVSILPVTEVGEHYPPHYGDYS